MEKQNSKKQRKTDTNHTERNADMHQGLSSSSTGHSLLHLAKIPTLGSDTFDQMSEISPNFFNLFKSRPKPSLYRCLDKRVTIPTLRQSVAIVTFGGRHRNCDTIPQSVTIATTRGKRHYCDGCLQTSQVRHNV